MATAEAPAQAKTEATPDPKPGGGKKGGGNKPKADAAAPAAKAAPKPKTIKPGMATKRPADLSKAVHQPDKMPTAAQVSKCREEWGIEAHVKDDKWVALKPGSRGRVIHAASGPKAETTYCFTPTTWVGGAAVVEDHAEMNCLFCQARIASYGKQA